MPETLADRNILIFIRDAGGRPLHGARVSFSLDGTYAGEVPSSEGRASIALPNSSREAKLEITAKYGDEEKKVTLAAGANDYEFRFDVVAESALGGRHEPQQLQRWLYVVITFVALGASVPAFVLLLGGPGGPGQYAGLAADRAFYLVLIWAGLAVAAFTFGAMNSVASFSGKIVPFTVQAGGPLAAVLIVVVLGFFLPSKPQQFVLLVRVRDVESGTVLKKGSVKLILDTDIRDVPIASTGEAHVGGVAESIIGTTVTVELESDGYELLPGSRQATVGPHGLTLSARKRPPAAPSTSQSSISTTPNPSLREISIGRAVVLDGSKSQHEWRGLTAWGESMNPVIKMVQDPFVAKELPGVLIIAPPYKQLWSDSEANDLRTWVERGGGLLLLGYYAADTHHGGNPSKIALQWGVSFQEALVLPKGATELNARQQVFSTDERLGVRVTIPSTPALPNAKGVVFLSSAPLDITRMNPKPEFVMRANSTATVWQPDGPKDPNGMRPTIERWTKTKATAPVVLVAFRSGRGKVAIIGTWKVTTLVAGDNSRLMEDLLAWLQPSH